MLKKIFYSVLDIITLKRGVTRVINGTKVKFPARWSRYYEKDYESENYAFLKQRVKPGMHIIDIGAHIGLFSVISSKLTGQSGKVVSFEPTPETYSVLKKTLQLNHCDNVMPLQAAISNENGKATFYIGNTTVNNSNSLVKNKPGEELHSHIVELLTIDTVVKTYSVKPGLIKIDAEGAELDVLKGGQDFILANKPIIILGLHPASVKAKGDSLETIWDLLKKYAYTIKLEEKEMTREDFCSREILFDVHCIAE